MSGLTYEQTGVNYDTLDAFKRACQKAAGTTTGSLAKHGLIEPESVRGESSYLLETANEYLAHVEEGLGTKNLVADAMLKLAGRSFYRNIGIDTVATMVNVHFAASTPNFFILEYHPDDESPRKDLLKEPLMVKDGYFPLPTKPGLGVELNEDAIRTMPAKRWRRGFEFRADGSVGFI